MLEAAQRLVLRLLKVPPEPDPPAGASDSVRVFRAARNYLYYSLFKWVMKQISTLVGIVVGLYFVAQGWMDGVQFGPFHGGEMFWVIEAIGIGGFLLQIPLTLAGVFLDFRMRWYVVTDRSLRIREGVGRVREKTMSFANIQNLAVEQGPVQRLLGISDLEVRTAGGGESAAQQAEQGGDHLHTGYFRGVDNAEEIKEIILQRLRRLRDSGLGDPDEALAAPLPQTPGAAGTAEGAGGASGEPAPAASHAPGDVLLAAARELLDEVRTLRQSA